MCLGCAVYSNKTTNYENVSEEQNNEDYSNHTYGE